MDEIQKNKERFERKVQEIRKDLLKRVERTEDSQQADAIEVLA